MKVPIIFNSYTHTDVYLDINKISSAEEDLLISLIKMNVFLISETYDLFANINDNEKIFKEGCKYLLN